MRWFIAFLLLANVILYFWMQQASRPVPGSGDLPPPDIGRLRLLSEIEQRAQPARIAVEPAAPTEAEHAPPIPLPGSPEAAPALDLPFEIGPGMDLPVPETADLTHAAIMRPPSEADHAEVTAAAEAAVLDPLGPTATAEQASDPAPSVQSADASADNGVESSVSASTDPAAAGIQVAICARVGPFQADEEADRLVASLPAGLALYSDVSEEYRRLDGYYVLIPALPSREAGNRKLRELAEAGVTDTWLFRTGELRNAISLGLFKRESSAKRHAEAVAKKGFDTRVDPKTSLREGRWLYLMSSDGTDIAHSLSLPEGVSVEARTCP